MEIRWILRGAFGSDPSAEILLFKTSYPRPRHEVISRDVPALKRFESFLAADFKAAKA